MTALVWISSSSLSGMSGSSSGVECRKVLKQYNSADVIIKNERFVKTNAGSPQQVSGNFVTDSSGKMDHQMRMMSYKILQ